jgi:putative peptidoglycan lipid II flippase
VAVLLLAMQQLPAWADGTMFWRLLRLGGLVGMGMLVYLAVLALLGFRLRDFARRSSV